MIYSDQDSGYIIAQAGLRMNEPYTLEKDCLEIWNAIEEDIDKFIGKPLRYIHILDDDFYRLYVPIFDADGYCRLLKRNAILDILYPIDDEHDV
jgi:hypothetical protein